MKRSPLTRPATTFRTVLKPKKCRHCKVRLELVGAVIHDECVAPWYEANKVKLAAKAAKAKAKAEREQKKKDREALHALKSPQQRRSEAKSKAQDDFNWYVRLRDHGLPCISCGVMNPPMTNGGQWDAGHFQSRGAYPEKAFLEDNCHKQCKSCNAGAGKFSSKERTVSEKYEANLIERIGLDRVEAVKAPHPPLHWEEADFLALASEYRAKARELEKRLKESA